MSDREKVIKDLEDIQKHLDTGYSFAICWKSELIRDVLSLLKEQETKCGYWINPTSQDCHCSECGEQPVHESGESVPLYDYCPYCGAKMEVKWNE